MGGLAIGNAQSEELQERQGERLGLVLIVVGTIVIALVAVRVQKGRRGSAVR